MSWSGYLAQFHRQRAGITEAVLRRCHDAGDANPYDWLAEATRDPAGPVLDLTCGSAPLWPLRPDRRYLGLDRSAAELSLAAARGAGPLVRADAAAIPLAAGAMPLVTCAMGLMLLEPLPEVLAEIRRVLRPGGKLVAILPASRPLTAADMAVVSGMVTALGRRLSYPNDPALARADEVFAAAGLQITADQSRRFRYRLTRPAQADTLVESLYLPGLTAARVRALRGYLRTLARLHATVPVPIRRLIAVSPPPARIG